MASSSTSEPASGFQVETLGVSEAIAPPDTASGELNHWLLRITIGPGVKLPRALEVTSTLIRVDSGSILVTVEDGEDVRVNLGHGGERIPIGQEVVLEGGNMVSLKRSTFVVRTTNAEPAVLTATALLPYDDARALCWICPRPW